MRITIALDDASLLATQEEEIAQVKLDFLQECGPDCVFIEHDVQRLSTMPRTDILVTDFGGLGVGYSSSGASRCGHELMKLIDSRPSTLFVLWSKHTERWYKDAIYEAMPSGERDDADEPPNPMNVRTWDWKDNDFWVEVRSWLGMREEPEMTPALEELIDKQREVIDRLADIRPRPHREEDYDDEDNYGDAYSAALRKQDEAEERDVEQAMDAAIEEKDQQKQAERDAIREQRRKDGTENDYHCDLPPEADGGPRCGDIVGTIQIPVRMYSRPGMTRALWHFKFADCMCDVTETDADGKEVSVATLGGMMGGNYEASFPIDKDRRNVAYFMATQDLWKAFNAFHADYLSAHPEVLTEKENGITAAAVAI